MRIDLISIAAAGVGLFALGMRRMGLLALGTSAAMGGARRMSGRCMLCGQRHQPQQAIAPGKEQAETGPSYQHQHVARARGSAQAPVDDVDEASMESFPASDPPSHSVHRT